MPLKFCPTCHNYLKFNAGVETEDGKKGNELVYSCVNCGYTEVETKGGLISEMILDNKSSEAYKIMINEYTLQDNTLPHIETLPCPKQTCPSNNGTKRDIVYMTYDAPAKKNLYICTVCKEQWKSRN